MKTVALVIFIAVYAVMLILPKYRAIAALGASAAFVLIGILPVREVVPAIDWNVLMMLAGTMGTVFLFIRSNMPERMADRLVRALPNVKWVLIALALFAGLVSAFIDNVATVLMLAPIGLAISKKLNISPVRRCWPSRSPPICRAPPRWWAIRPPFCWAAFWKMDFADFFVMDGKPGMFWVVQAGALIATIPVLMFLFRKDNDEGGRAGADGGDGSAVPSLLCWPEP
jgi:hypothetical protein